MPWFCQNAVFCRVFGQNAVFLRFLQEFFVFNQHKLKFTKDKNIYLCFCYQSQCALLLAGSICDRDVIVEICILSRIFFSGVRYCSAATNFYRCKNCTACNDGHQSWMLSFIDCIMVFRPMTWCHVFAVIFAIFTKVCCVFHHFLPWFSTAPIDSLKVSGLFRSLGIGVKAGIVILFGGEIGR